MTYGYTCNMCGSDYPDTEPAFMGRLHETWFKTSHLGGVVAGEVGLTHEDTVTLCPECIVYEVLL